MSANLSGPTELAASSRMEEMIQAIVAEFDRTFTTLEREEALIRVKGFLGGLDEPALRALGYRQGIFEQEAGSGRLGDEEC